MNKDDRYVKSNEARCILLAIVAVASTIIIAALSLGPKQLLKPSQAKMFERLQVPRSIGEINSLTRLQGIPLYSLDSVTIMPGGLRLTRTARTQNTVSLGRGQSITLSGWASDPDSLRPADGVLFEVDGRFVLMAQYGLRRPDVAAAFGDPAFTATGFALSIPAGYFKPGLHAVDLIVNNSYGDKYYFIKHLLLIREAY